MRRSLASALVLWLGCASPPPPAEPYTPPTSPAGVDRTQIERETETLMVLAKAACACRDAACASAVDRDYVAYAETATINDPVTDLETWPSDLDALGRAAVIRIDGCMREHRVETTARAVASRRKLEMFRDAACRCPDASCARRVDKPFRALLEKMSEDPPARNMDELERINALATEAKRCVDAPLWEEAMLALKKVRSATCACTDSACAAEQREALAAWTAEYGNVQTTVPEELDHAKELGRDIGECLGRAAAAP